MIFVILLLGTSFFQGTTTGLEIVDNIRQEIQVLVTYADVICKSGDTEFSRVHAKLSQMYTKLSQNKERILKLENVSHNSKRNIYYQSSCKKEYRERIYSCKQVLSWKIHAWYIYACLNHTGRLFINSSKQANCDVSFNIWYIWCWEYLDISKYI